MKARLAVLEPVEKRRRAHDPARVKVFESATKLYRIMKPVKIGRACASPSGHAFKFNSLIAPGQLVYLDPEWSRTGDLLQAGVITEAP